MKVNKMSGIIIQHLLSWDILNLTLKFKITHVSKNTYLHHLVDLRPFLFIWINSTGIMSTTMKQNNRVLRSSLDKSNAIRLANKLTINQIHPLRVILLKNIKGNKFNLYGNVIKIPLSYFRINWETSLLLDSLSHILFPRNDRKEIFDSLVYPIKYLISFH